MRDSIGWVTRDKQDCLLLRSLIAESACKTLDQSSDKCEKEQGLWLGSRRDGDM